MGVLYLESCPSDEEFKVLLETKLLGMSRFRSALKVNKHGGRFVEVEEFDWKYHVGKAFEEETISEETLVEFVGNMYERGLDLTKPLWRNSP